MDIANASRKIKDKEVKKANDNGVKPVEIVIAIYPLTRPLFQYTNGAPAGVARDFIKFELGDKGQEVVEKVGFLKLSEKQVAKNLSIIQGDSQ